MTLRMIVLTVSLAPVTARQKNVSQNDRDKPKTRLRRRKWKRLSIISTAAVDAFVNPNHRCAGRHRANRRRIQPAVALSSNVQHVLCEKDSAAERLPTRNVARKSNIIVDQ